MGRSRKPPKAKAMTKDGEREMWGNYSGQENM